MNGHRRAFRLDSKRTIGESLLTHQQILTHQQNLKALNGNATKFAPPEKLFADLLKRQARAVMRSITTCEPQAIPAHVERIDALLEVIRHARTHDLISDAEKARTEAALVFAVTVADFQAALLLTRETHRAPSWAHALAEDELAALHRKIDKLAGLLAQPGTFNAVMAATEAE